MKDYRMLTANCSVTAYMEVNTSAGFTNLKYWFVYDDLFICINSYQIRIDLDCSSSS